MIEDVIVGVLGKVKNSIIEHMQLTETIFAAEFDFEKLISNARPMPTYKPYNPFAAIQLDLTIPLNKTYARIVQIAKESAPHLTQITLKDTYKDNITLHMVFSAINRNYTEKEALVELEGIKRKLAM